MEKFFFQTGKLLAETTYEAKKLTIIICLQVKLEISSLLDNPVAIRFFVTFGENFLFRLNLKNRND